MRFAKTISGDYSIGYQNGLRAAYHGEVFQGGLEKLLRLKGDRGDGFRDAYKGKRHKDAPPKLGGSNAQMGDEPRDETLRLRVTKAEKSKWDKTAHPEVLSGFVRSTLNAKSNLIIRKCDEQPKEAIGALIVQVPFDGMEPMVVGMNEFSPESGWDRPLKSDEHWIEEESLLALIGLL